MPRLADIAAGRARLLPYTYAPAPSGVEAEREPHRARRRFPEIKLTKDELCEFRAAHGLILSLEKAAEIAGLTPKSLKKQLSQGKYRNCVKRKKPIRFITERFIQELFGGSHE